MNKKYFFGLFLLVVGLIQCSTPVDRFTQLQDNVVAIHSTFESGYEEYGFGIVLGCSDGRLFIATAAHVVEQTGDSTLSNLVRFRGNDVDHPFKLIRSNKELDIALIEGTRPSSYQWIKNYEGSEVQSRQRVGYIGRNQEWYIPTEAVRGQINSIRDDRIIIDINGVSRGTSGAPLLNSSGIIGLIIEAEGAQARAIDWKRVKEELTDNGAYTVYLGDEGGVEGNLDESKQLSLITIILTVLLIPLIYYFGMRRKGIRAKANGSGTIVVQPELINGVKKAIANGQIEKALAILNQIKYKDPESEEFQILLQARYADLRKKERMGILSMDDLRIRQNRLLRDILDFLSRLE